MAIATEGPYQLIRESKYFYSERETNLIQKDIGFL